MIVRPDWLQRITVRITESESRTVYTVYISYGNKSSGLQSVGSVDDVDYPSVRFGDERCDPSLPRPTRAHQITPTSA